MDVLRNKDGRIRNCILNKAAMSIRQNQKHFHPYKKYWAYCFRDLDPRKCPALLFIFVLPILPVALIFGPWFAAWYNRRKAIEEIIYFSMLDAIKEQEPKN